jgi:hypothetical protein
MFAYISSCYQIHAVMLILKVKTLKHCYADLYQILKLLCYKPEGRGFDSL